MANERPKVSVVMLSYNRAHTIRGAVESVLAQSFGDFELLVVDECSADGTDEVLASIKDPRIRVIKERAGGIAPARNVGLREARGEYLVYCDSDDEQQPARLGAQAAVLDRYPEVGMVFCDSYVWLEAKTVVHDSLLRSRWLGPTTRTFEENLQFHIPTAETCRVANVPVPPAALDRNVWRGKLDGWLCTCHLAWGHTQMYRTQWGRELGGHWNRLRCYEDWELSSKFSKVHPLAFLDVPLVKYRIHPGRQSISTPRPNAESYLENIFYSWRADRIFYPRHKDLIDWGIGVGYATLGEVEAREGHFQEAEECYRRAVFEGVRVGKRVCVSFALATLKYRVPFLRTGSIGERIPGYMSLGAEPPSSS